jgi:hypothetical protein
MSTVLGLARVGELACASITTKPARHPTAMVFFVLTVMSTPTRRASQSQVKTSCRHGMPPPRMKSSIFLWIRAMRTWKKNSLVTQRPSASITMATSTTT